VPLAGVVLHASRCGSTAVLSALGSWPGIVTVDEPPDLDVALTQARAGGGTDALDRVVARLGALGDRVIVKADAWHVLEMRRLLAAAPGVPWLFVHRDPAEILVSHSRQPGSHTVPGVLSPIWFGPAQTVHPLPHAAAVLSAIFGAVTPYAGPQTMVGHGELPEAVPGRLAAHFDLDPAAVDRAALAAVMARHAKRPYEPYVDDRAEKQQDVSAVIEALVAFVVGPAYRELLRRRDRAAA
jgi:hypothetical protein